MSRLDQQKQELDLQRLKQEEERKKKEQTLILAELEEYKRRRLEEITLAELEPTEVVSEFSQSLRDALSELSTHIQKVKSVRLKNWATSASTEINLLRWRALQ